MILSQLDQLSLRVKIYVVNYRKVVNIGIPRGRQPGRGYGMFNRKKSSDLGGDLTMPNSQNYWHKVIYL